MAPDRQITFSSGNLQYNAAQGTHSCADGSTQQGTWRFAEHQYDYVGDAAIGNVYQDGVKCNNALVSATYDGWIDLFGWGTGNAPTQTSTSTSDYSSFVDWGQNAISNGGNEAGMWRTLSKDEWTYLFHGRANYDKLFALGKVAGVNGVILLPDDWTTPAGLSFLPSAEDGLNWDGTYYSCNECDRYTDNTYTTEQWGAMEANGAVFFPAAGSSVGTEVHYPGENGRYWSSTQNGPDSAYYAGFYKLFLMTHGSNHRYYGRCVRLVKDTVVIPTYVPKPFSVSANKQVTFSPGNLQYNAAQGTHPCADGTTQPGTWRFAEHQYDYVGDAENGTVYDNGTKCDNELISDTYDGWIDLFGWGTSGWNSGANTWQPWATSRNQKDYYPGGSEENNLIGDYAYADWGQYNAVGDDPAGTWRTLTNEEWNYLFRSRDNAEQLFGLGTVDDVPGVILLPDDWVTPPGVSFNASTDKGLSWQGRYYENNTDNNYSHNTYTSKQWEEQMAVNGAVFLPATGYRYETDVYYMSTQYTGEYGSYWSSSANDTVYAYDCNFSISLLRSQHPALRYGGRSVRLVKDIPTAPPSAYRSLPFSVSADKQVWFSSGNLQYNAARMTHQCADGTTQPGTWRFAKHQYDFVGDAEEGTIYVNGIKCDNAQISDSYIGWIDLFGWGTSGWNSGANAYQPWASSPTNSDYNPGNNENNDLTGDYAYADWSVYNQIGKDPAGAWRTLAKDEWEYLFCERENADKLFGLGTVNGVQGAILLPDEWTMPDGATFTPSTEKGLEWNGTSYESSTKDLYTHNSYTASQWVIMEAAGAVFLPAGGGRSGITVNYVAESGNYWTTTHNTEEDAFRTRFYTHYLNPSYHSGRHLGRTVRPVSDVPLPPPSTYEPKPFSVSADKQVLFSSGNLQYNAALGAHVSADGTIQPGTWRFAEHQWDYVGDAENGTVYQYNLKCDNALISETYNGWIDLFGWGTSGWNSGAKAYRPWEISQHAADYSPCEAGENNLTGCCAYADWGVYNPIGNAPAGTWRTLTSEEWLYLFRERKNAEKLFGLGTVNGIPGTIILPDDWTTPTDVIFTPSTDKDLTWEDSNYTNSNEDNYSHNTYTSKQWEEQMEANGAVFLPATGYRYGTKVSYTGSQKTGGYGSFWSSSADDGTHAYDVNFSISSLRPQYSAIRYGARAVRLAKDYTPPPPPSTYEPKPFSVSADKQILFSSGNLQYNAAQGSHQCADGSTQPGTWRFAEHQYDYVGDAENGNVYQNGVKCDNELISETYDGWIDLFGWGTSGWSDGVRAYQAWAASAASEDYYLSETGASMIGDYVYADWGVYNGIGNDAPQTWRTLGKDEWHYLFCDRQNAENLFAMGTVNGIQGLIILPDGWETREELPFTPSTQKGFEWHSSRFDNTNSEDRYKDNIYTALQWALMESLGAVFMPVTGYRAGPVFDHADNFTDGWGHYWASTAEGTNVYRVNFSKDYLSPLSQYARNRGFAVRLIKDVEQVPPPEDQCTDVTTEFSYTMYKGETYLWEGTEYKTSGDHTKTFQKADGCDSIVTLHLTVLPPECLGNYDTVRFCPGLNSEHDEVVRHGYCLRYLPYRYESPEEWDYMEGVVLVRDSDRTLVDLARAERNLREHYTDDLTPVQSVHWSLCKNGTNDYHAIEVESEPQWIEAGTLTLTVYFLCGQRYYSNFATDLGNVQGDDVPCTKVLLNGHIFILRGEHVYDLRGTLLQP